MPSWPIHLSIAKKVNEKLKLNKDLFYYGNLIPDVDKNSSINRYQAHYYDKNLPYFNCPKEHMINIDLFLKDYKDNLSNPLILGYYCHLLADYYYNLKVYTTKWVCDEENNIIGIKLKNNKIIKLDKEDKNKLRKKYKHSDFELYGKYLFNTIEIPTNSEIIKDNIKYLKDNLLTDELVDYRIKYLKTDFIKNNKLTLKERLIKNNYKLFTKTELNKMLEECVNLIIEKINDIGELK